MTPGGFGGRGVGAGVGGRGVGVGVGRGVGDGVGVGVGAVTVTVDGFPGIGAGCSVPETVAANVTCHVPTGRVEVPCHVPACALPLTLTSGTLTLPTCAEIVWAF